MGVGTLFKICRDHDVPDAIMRAVFMGNPADDFEGFEDPDWDSGITAASRMTMVCHRSLEYNAGSDLALVALNEKYTAVFANGSYRIMYREGEGETSEWIALGGRQQSGFYQPA